MECVQTDDKRKTWPVLGLGASREELISGIAGGTVAVVRRDDVPSFVRHPGQGTGAYIHDTSSCRAYP
jgi:hypothetical protein